MANMTDWNKRKKSAAALSIGSNTVLVLGKLIVGLVISSVSVISEAIHSAMDLVAAIVAFFAVRESAKPPDKKHPFGHGKAEGLSGALEGILILIAIVIIVLEAIRKMISGSAVESVDLGMAVMAFSAVMNSLVSWRLYKVARKTESLALEADALHLSTDVFTSVGVFVGLLLIRLTGLHILDPIIALGVAVVIGHAAYDIIRRSLRDLMDEKLSDDEADAIREVLEKHHDQFIGFHDLRSRRIGSGREIDLHLVQCRNINLADAHSVCDHLEEEMQSHISNIHATIHVEPCEDECQENYAQCRVDRSRIAAHIAEYKSRKKER